MVLTDPPWNLPTRYFSGLGRHRHPDFAMARGEKSEGEFTEFLSTFLRLAKEASKPGAIMFVFMDWRHLFELLTAARAQQLPQKNLIVWAKRNAGMGTFYRSQHELIAVFKNGDAPHLNTFELGQHGRHRSNLWEYAGGNSFHVGRAEELGMHPTCKPVALLADAIRDVSRRGAIVLDPFAGSGSTLIAAEKTGRRAYLLEIDPVYSDVIIRRFEAYTGKTAQLDGEGMTFEEAENTRVVRSNRMSDQQHQIRVRNAMARKPKTPRRGSDNKPDMRNNVSSSTTPSPEPEEEYKVGPGRPPKEHQWKPGQSGNPKGAKRKNRSLIPELKEEFERVFSQKLKVTQGDRQRLISRWVAGLEQLSIQFAKGDRHARRDVFYFAEKLGVDLLTSAKVVRRHALRRSSGDPRSLRGAANAGKGHLCIRPCACAARTAR